MKYINLESRKLNKITLFFLNQKKVMQHFHLSSNSICKRTNHARIFQRNHHWNAASRWASFSENQWKLPWCSTIVCLISAKSSGSRQISSSQKTILILYHSFKLLHSTKVWSETLLQIAELSSLLLHILVKKPIWMLICKFLFTSVLAICHMLPQTLLQKEKEQY